MAISSIDHERRIGLPVTPVPDDLALAGIPDFAPPGHETFRLRQLHRIAPDSDLGTERLFNIAKVSGMLTGIFGLAHLGLDNWSLRLFELGEALHIDQLKDIANFFTSHPTETLTVPNAVTFLLAATAFTLAAHRATSSNE